MCRPDNVKEYRFHCKKHDVLSNYGCNKCIREDLLKNNDEYNPHFSCDGTGLILEEHIIKTKIEGTE